MFSTDFIFRQQENLVDNQKCQAGFRLLCNKILGDLVKLGDKERFDKEQIRVKEPFPVNDLPVYFIRIRNIWH